VVATRSPLIRYRLATRGRAHSRSSANGESDLAAGSNRAPGWVVDQPRGLKLIVNDAI
jgi:hypothetical protein